jgi:hypothetical protein
MSSIALRERHIDRLLSEELEASPEFAAWFVRQVFNIRAPAADPASCTTVISHHRVEGETDVLVNLNWLSGEIAIIHIEDKLGALPQPDQALRYDAVVQATECNLKACVLVAPRAWMRRHPRETSIYTTAVPLEDIASFLKSRAELHEARRGTPDAVELAKRLRWREQLLSGATPRRSVYRALQAGELTDWNQAAAEVVAAKNGLVLTVAPRQRSEGQNKESRFIRFAEQLSPYRNGTPRSSS